MINKIDIIRKFDDVFSWLGTFDKMQDREFFGATGPSKVKTAKHFKIPFGKVDQLSFLDEDFYKEQDAEILNFYYQSIRETPEFHKWISKKEPF